MCFFRQIVCFCPPWKVLPSPGKKSADAHSMNCDMIFTESVFFKPNLALNLNFLLPKTSKPGLKKENKVILDTPLPPVSATYYLNGLFVEYPEVSCIHKFSINFPWTVLFFELRLSGIRSRTDSSLLIRTNQGKRTSLIWSNWQPESRPQIR